jgi:clavulanate-9-aldehyde reductase
MQALAGRVGVITGASSGIGEATARLLAEAGMTVIAAARRADRLRVLAEAIRQQGGRAEVVPTDMRVESEIENLIETAVARHGRLDVLVNNAAVGMVRLIAEGRTAEWREMLDTNTMGTMVACRAALRHMLPRGRGDIVNVSSAATQGGWPYLAVYAASKAAVDAFSRGLRAEVAEQGIRVMTVDVHNVATGFASSFDPAVMPAAIARWRELGLLNPKAETIRPDDVARAIVFQLAQPDPVSVHELTIRSRVN